MPAADMPCSRHTCRVAAQVLKGFLVAGPTLAIAWRVGFPEGAGAFPVTSDEMHRHPGPHRRPHPDGHARAITTS